MSQIIMTIFSASFARRAALGFGFCLVSLVATRAPADEILIPAAPQVAAEAYILMDADSGKVLVEHDGDQQLPPASLTKMMTTYIVSEEIEKGRLQEDSPVRISETAWRRGGVTSGSSTMFLEPDTEVPVIDLMRGVIIQSGNDASIALAEHLAGSESAFADVMNQQAQLLGMDNTHFKNATGWPEEGHVSTARDLAILARALIRHHPEHYAIYSEKYFQYNGINQPNRNKLLFRNPEVDGIKTGHTEDAGYGLVASAERNDMRLIAVVLGTASEEARAQEAQKLLSYGFRYYQTHELYAADATLTSAPVWAGKADEVALGINQRIVVTIPRGAHEKLKAETAIDEVIKAPLAAGDVLGELTVTLNDETLVKEDLVAQQAVEEAGFFARLWDNIRLFFKNLFS